MCTGNREMPTRRIQKLMLELTIEMLYLCETEIVEGPLAGNPETGIFALLSPLCPFFPQIFTEHPFFFKIVALLKYILHST